MRGSHAVLQLKPIFESSLKDIWQDHSLAGDYCEDFSRVSPFFPCSRDRLEENLGRLPPSEAHPAELVADLLRYNTEMGAGKETAANIERLGKPGTLVVITGQQPGIMTGPVYAVYKAITAIKYAGYLEKKIGGRVVPVYWNATEDHDFEEVNHLYSWDRNNALQRLEIPGRREDIDRCVGSVEVAGIDLVGRFRETVTETEFTEETCRILQEALDNSGNLGDWFSRIMLRLFGKHGLVIVDSCRPALRRLSVPLFRKALEDPLQGSELINRAGKALEKIGYPRQLYRPEKACSFFLMEKGKRTRVTYEDGVYSAKDRKYSKDDLLARLANSPEEFSACVAIRPIIADYLFNTAVSVVGPGEIAYFAQLKSMYEAMEVREPVLIPRLSLTLLDEEIGGVLDQWGTDPSSLREDVSKLIEQETRNSSIIASEEFWSDLRAGLRSRIEVAAEKAGQRNRLFKDPFETANTRISRRIDRLEKKILQIHRKQDRKQNDRLVKARNYLYPRNNLQERYVNIFYFLNRFGLDLVDRLIDELPAGTDKHLFIKLWNHWETN
ncbi:MAG: bacillithiol biosynthesis cysteine-adding enzyme BshC [bacterium]